MLLKNEFRSEISQFLDELPESLFSARGYTKKGIQEDAEKMERLWYVYQKDIEEYECDPDWSALDALHEVLGIQEKEITAAANETAGKLWDSQGGISSFLRDIS